MSNDKKSYYRFDFATQEIKDAFKAYAAMNRKSIQEILKESLYAVHGDTIKDVFPTIFNKSNESENKQ